LADTPLSSSDLILSHPGRALTSHLEGVYTLLPQKTKEPENVLQLAAYCHDIAKASSAFQHYIQNTCSVNPAKKAHTPLSALVAFFCAQTLRFDNETTYLLYTTIKNHHGYLHSPQEDLDSIALGKRWYSLFIEQWNSIPHGFLEWVSSRVHINLLDFKVDPAMADLDAFADEFILADYSDNLFFRIRLFLSALVAADRQDAVLRGSRNELPPRADADFDSYIRNLPRSGRLSPLRQRFYEDIASYAEVGPGFYSVTAPTGVGKTLANLKFATNIRASRKEKPLIVYALPFINIIEQTYETASKIFGSDVMAYHHLALLDENPEEPLLQRHLAYDTWDSDVVITTFVGLLEGLISPKRVPFLCRLNNAIIILDEVQSVPIHYWGIIRYTLNTLVNSGATVILSTATMPAIVESPREVCRIRADLEKSLNRTTLIRHPETDLHGFSSFVREEIARTDRVLVICNTIAEAEKVFQGTVDFKPEFLSSLVPPVERRKRIERLKGDKPAVCVATQVIEAGVDLSFDSVIRDIAPLDSIIQAAGRCNRNYNNETGTVHIIPVRERGTLYSSRVYGTALTDIAMEVLPKEVYEPEYHALLEKYYTLLRDRMDTESMSLIHALKTMDYSESQKFSLIQQKGTAASFLLFLDEKVQILLEKARQNREALSEMKGRNEERFNYLAKQKNIFRELAPYIVSTSLSPTDESLPPDDFHFILIDPPRLNEWYDPILGLRRIRNPEAVIW